MKGERWEDVLGRFTWENSVAASTIVTRNPPFLLQQDRSHQPSNPTSYDQDMETLFQSASLCDRCSWAQSRVSSPVERSVSGFVAIPTNHGVRVAGSRRRMKMTSLSPGQWSRNDRRIRSRTPLSHQRRKRKQTTSRLHCLSIVPRQACALVISSHNRHLQWRDLALHCITNNMPPWCLWRILRRPAIIMQIRDARFRASFGSRGRLV